MNSKELLNEKIERMFAYEEELKRCKEALTPRETRIEMVDDVCEWYFAETGSMPDGYQLEQLSNFILLDEIKDQRKNKMNMTEYPFASDIQLKRRRSKEFTFEWAAGRTSSDKRDVSSPKRKYVNYSSYKK